MYREHTQHHLAYLQYHAAKQTKAQQPGTQPKLDDVLYPAKAPPQFDQLGVAGLAKPYIPSGQYVSAAWLEAVQPVVKTAWWPCIFVQVMRHAYNRLHAYPDGRQYGAKCTSRLACMGSILLNSLCQSIVAD